MIYLYFVVFCSPANHVQLTMLRLRHCLFLLHQITQFLAQLGNLVIFNTGLKKEVYGFWVLKFQKNRYNYQQGLEFSTRKSKTQIRPTIEKYLKTPKNMNNLQDTARNNKNLQNPVMVGKEVGVF